MSNFNPDALGLVNSMRNHIKSGECQTSSKPAGDWLDEVPTVDNSDGRFVSCYFDSGDCSTTPSGV